MHFEIYERWHSDKYFYNEGPIICFVAKIDFLDEQAYKQQVLNTMEKLY